jgi:hypothetical protein
MTSVPVQPKIYHIVHVDRLASILADGCLWSDAVIAAQARPGSTIGMASIKHRRLYENTLASHPDLTVGGCVPFYFCPRSIMLYLIHMANHPELSYRGGQQPIIHLEADLRRTVAWAEANGRRWAFTLSNAGSRFFEDRCDLGQLDEVDWDAVRATRWSGGTVPPSVKEGKQAEFLLEERFPWNLVERIGVSSSVTIYRAVANLLAGAAQCPPVEMQPSWYY